MKNAIVISFSILFLFLVIGVIGGIGFFFFNKRLTQSRELKESTGILSETGKANLLSAVETDISLEILSPSDQSTVTSPVITFRGKTVPQAEVFVNDKETIADANGNFSVELTLDEGENSIMVVANDENGNVSEKEINVWYEIPE